MIFEINKKIADELMLHKGEFRGVALKTDEKFILNRGGEEAIKEIESEITKLGYSLDYSNINSMAFYPIGLRMISLLVIINKFKMEKEDIIEMGSFAPKVSVVIKFFLQYFISPQKTFNQVSEIWKKHYTIGEVVPIKISDKDKEASIKLQDFKIHPAFCIYLLGYLSKIVEIVIKGQAQGKEQECPFKDGKDHVYSFKW